MRESEEKFRILTETSAAAIFFHQGGKFIYANPAAEEITGYTHHELLNMNFWEFIAPEYRETVKSRGLTRLSGDNHIPRYEVKIITKQGFERWLDLSSARMEYRGKPAIMATAMDITQRKQAEKALRLAKFTIGSASDELFWIESNGHIFDVNEAACAALGYTPDELSRMYVWDIDPNYPRETWAAHWQELKERRSLKFESDQRTKDGRTFPTEVTLSYLEFEGNEYDCAIVQDITERKRAEESLKLTQFALDNFRDSAIWFSLDGRIAYVNDEACQSLGYAREELLSMHIWDIDPGVNYALCQAVWNELKQQNGFGKYEQKHVTRDGRVFPVDVTASYVKYGEKEYIISFDRDITERKLAEEKISHLASFPSLNPSPIIETDLEGNPSYMNPSAVKTFPDLNEKGAAHPMLTGLKAVADELEAQKKNYIFREVAVGDSYFQETVQKVPDKMALRIYALDITERKKAEDAVRKSDVRFRSLIQNSSDIIRILDNEGRIIFDSPSSEKILGYPPGYTLGKFPFEFIHPDDVKFVQEELDTVYDKRNSGIPIEFRIRKADGEYLWVESTGVNMTGVPGVDGIVITTRPIGERKRAEEALRKNEEMLRRIIDSSPIPIALHEENGKVIYINKKFTKTFGYTIEDVPSLNEWWMLAYPDKEYRAFVKNKWDSAIDHAIKNNVSIPPREVEVTCKDGSKRQILSEFSSIGSVYMSVLYDITERKKSEEELKAAKQQADLYLDLMGHDINNLHQIALGYLELARDMPPGEEQAIFLDKPVEVLQRSTQLIKNVRKLQKLRDGLFKTEQVDVCRVISDVQREFGAVPGKRVMLNFNGRERCFVLANELLHDVFANLVSNAIKHTGSRAEIVVDLDVIRDHGCRYCRVLVEDNGPGIPDDFKVKIFDRTLRGTNNAKGMGLGLYLVKSLVDSYGGSVRVEDRVFDDHTKGARFVVLLPAIEK